MCKVMCKACIKIYFGTVGFVFDNVRCMLGMCWVM